MITAAETGATERRRKPLTGAVLLLAVLTLGAITPLPDRVRVGSALCAILLGLPIVLAGLRPPRRPCDISGVGKLVALSLLIGLIPAVLLTGAGLLGVRLPVLLASYYAGLALLILAGARTARQAPETPGESAPVRSVFLWLLPVLAVAMLIAALRGTPLGATDDSFDHLASLRHIMESGRVEFPGAFFGLNDVAGPDPRKGIMLTGLALAGCLAGADATVVWRWSAIVLTPLMILALASLSLVLFRRSFSGAAGALAFIIAWGDPLWLLRGGYGGHWGLATAWAGIACLLAGAGFQIGVLAGLVSASVHAYSPSQMMTPLVFVVLFSAFRKDMRISGLAGILAGALPVELLRFLAGNGGGNPLHDQAMGWLLLSPGAIASPLQLLGWYGYAGVVAGLFVVLMAPRIRDRAGLFLLGSFTVPLLLLLNPFLFAPVAEALGSVANKVTLVWIYPLAIVWILARAFSPEKTARVSALLGGGLIAVLIVPALPARGSAWFADGRLSSSLRGAARLVEEGTPPGAVVASDPMTSYALPALTGRRAVVSLHQHAPPGDSRALERLAIAAALYSDCVPLDEAINRVRNEGAGYILFADPPATRLDQFGNHFDPRNRDRIAARFASRPDLLETVTGDGASTLYRIRSAATGTPPASASRGRAGIPAPKSPDHVVVSDGTITLAVNANLPAVRRRGERLVLPVAWRREGAPAPYLEYLGHLRFESEEAPPVRGFWKYFSKPLRRIVLEPMAGGSHRWRAVEMPFRGLCPPAEWPVDVWLPDSMDVMVPDQLVPGRYRVRVSLERGTLYPRLTLADLFMDEDRFSGPVLGSLLIQ